MKVNELIRYLQKVPPTTEVNLLLYGFARQYSVPLDQSRLYIDPVTKELMVVADDN